MTQTIEKQRAFNIAVQVGILRELVRMRGGKGDARKPLTAKERDQRKTRRQMARNSRRGNR